MTTPTPRERQEQVADLARQNAFYRDHPRVDAEPDDDDLDSDTWTSP